ncbi:hypothetical protein BKA93DRAFT_599867 [Sparassis latifolia]
MNTPFPPSTITSTDSLVAVTLIIMLASSRLPIVRASNASSARLATCRIAGRQTASKTYSTVSTQSSSSSAIWSHVGAGVAGGTVVVAGGYVWYHFSGAKQVLDASNAVQEYYAKTKRAIVENAPKNPNDVLTFLRSTVKLYAGFIPGASSYVDATFDSLDELHDTHRGEVDKILGHAYDEVKGILKQRKEGSDVETGMKVLEVVKRRMGELQGVGKKVGQDVMQNLGDKFPQVSETLGGGYNELKNMAEKMGPEAKKIFDDTTCQVKDIFSKGFSPERLNQAKELIQAKTEAVGKLAETSSQDAWNKAVQQAEPYLDKLPEIKHLLNENASKFIAAGSGSSTVAQEVLARVREAAEAGVSGNEEKMRELRNFVSKKASQAENDGRGSIEKGWDALQQWIKTVPGGEDALEKTPEVKTFIQLSRERSDDAQKLTHETYEAVLKVLEEKGQKAKKLIGKSEEDVTEETSS